MSHIGLSANAVANSGNALALAEQSLRFLAPLRSHDRVCPHSAAFIPQTYEASVSLLRYSDLRGPLFSPSEVNPP